MDKNLHISIVTLSYLTFIATQFLCRSHTQRIDSIWKCFRSEIMISDLHIHVSTNMRLFVFAVGHGRPLIWTSFKTHIKFRLRPNIYAMLLLYFIRCRTTSGVPNIVGWPTARSKLSVKSVGLPIAWGKLVYEFNFHKECVNLPCRLYKRNKY